LPVLQHAVRSLESDGCHFDAVCLLQPTSPFRTSALIDECIARFISSHADSVVTVLPVPHHYNPHWVFFADDTGALWISTGDAHPIARRQELPPAYHRDGSVYVTRRDVLMDQNSLLGSRIVGCPADPRRSLNVDTPEDFARAERLIRQQPWRTLPASAHRRPTVPRQT
jgi:CMP-N-acetylneuraminic acid synthetase